MLGIILVTVLHHTPKEVPGPAASYANTDLRNGGGGGRFPAAQGWKLQEGGAPPLS